MQNVGTKIIVGIFDCYVPKSCIISKLIQVQTSTDTNHKVRKCIWSQTEKCKLTFQIDMANSSTPRIPPFFWENSIVFIIDVKHQIRQYKMKKKLSNGSSEDWIDRIRKKTSKNFNNWHICFEINLFNNLMFKSWALSWLDTLS